MPTEMLTEQKRQPNRAPYLQGQYLAESGLECAKTNDSTSAFPKWLHEYGDSTYTKENCQDRKFRRYVNLPLTLCRSQHGKTVHLLSENGVQTGTKRSNGNVQIPFCFVGF